VIFPTDDVLLAPYGVVLAADCEVLDTRGFKSCEDPLVGCDELIKQSCTGEVGNTSFMVLAIAVGETESGWGLCSASISATLADEG